MKHEKHNLNYTTTNLIDINTLAQANTRYYTIKRSRYDRISTVEDIFANLTLLLKLRLRKFGPLPCHNGIVDLYNPSTINAKLQNSLIVPLCANGVPQVYKVFVLSCVLAPLLQTETVKNVMISV